MKGSLEQAVIVDEDGNYRFATQDDLNSPERSGSIEPTTREIAVGMKGTLDGMKFEEISEEQAAALGDGAMVKVTLKGELQKLNAGTRGKHGSDARVILHVDGTSDRGCIYSDKGGPVTSVHLSRCVGCMAGSQV